MLRLDLDRKWHLKQTDIINTGETVRQTEPDNMIGRGGRKDNGRKSNEECGGGERRGRVRYRDKRVK